MTLGFEVLQEVVEGDSVASRWALHGTHRGRRVRLTGTDTLELVRQLGAWRTLLLVVAHPRLLHSAKPSEPATRSARGEGV